MTELFTQLTRLKAWLDAFRPLPASVVAELRQRYTVRLTYHSNALEGNTLTQSETEMVITSGVTVSGKTLVEHLEAIGHRDALAFIEELAQKNGATTERDVRDIHALLLRTVDPVAGTRDAGRYRTLDVQAAGTGYRYPPHYEITERMDAFVTWLNSDAAQQMHPVQFASEVHLRFVSIHPFRDGNGRTARLLLNLALLRAGFPVAIIRREERAAYINGLVAAQQNGESEPLTRLIGFACRASLSEYLSVLSTAQESWATVQPFYAEMVSFLQDAETFV